MIFGMTYYQICMYFLIYSFLGWCLEVVYHALRLGKIVNRGFLNGPVCPVYGFGMLAVCVLIHFLPTDAGTGEPNVLAVFFGGMALTTTIEFVAGFLLYHLFHARWWDYSRLPLNIGGYICPLYSVFWGIACVLVVKYVHPLVAISSRTGSGIPPKYGWPVMIVLYFIYLVDFIVTVMTVAGLNRKLKSLDEMRSKLRIVSNGLSDVLAVATIRTEQKAQESRLEAELAAADMKDRAEERAARTVGAMEAAAAVGKARTAELKEQMQTRAEDRRAEAAESAKSAAMDAKKAVQGRKEEISAQYVELQNRIQALSDDIRGHRHFGTGRLLRAFPSMVHRDYDELVKELQVETREKKQ